MARAKKGKAKRESDEHAYDQHFRIYKKHWHEVKHLSTRCPVCGHRIDEFGYCGCGTGSS